MSGYDFYGNTIINATTGVLLGGGRRNRIHDNLFIGCDTDIAFDDRGLNWMGKATRPCPLAALLSAHLRPSSFSLQSCVKDCDPAMGTSCLYATLASLNYTQARPPTSSPLPPPTPPCSRAAAASRRHLSGRRAQPPYSTHYPEIVNIYDNHPCTPVDNVIEDNRCRSQRSLSSP